MDIGLGGLGEEEVGAWLEGGGVRVGRARREERLLNVGSLWLILSGEQRWSLW